LPICYAWLHQTIQWRRDWFSVRSSEWQMFLLHQQSRPRTFTVASRSLKAGQWKKPTATSAMFRPVDRSRIVFSDHQILSWREHPRLLTIVHALLSVVLLFGLRATFPLFSLLTYFIQAHQRRQKQENFLQHSCSQPVCQQRNGERCIDKRRLVNVNPLQRRWLCLLFAFAESVYFACC